MYYVYIVTCAEPNHYYVGITRDHDNRRREHKVGGGKTSAFVRKFGFLSMRIVTETETEQEAKRLETLYVMALWYKQEGRAVVAGAAFTSSEGWKPKPQWLYPPRDVDELLKKQPGILFT